MKRLITIIALAVVSIVGINELYAQSRNIKTPSKKTQTKKTAGQTKTSAKFSIETILNKGGDPLSSLGSSLEKAGFTLKSQREQRLI